MIIYKYFSFILNYFKLVEDSLSFSIVTDYYQHYYLNYLSFHFFLYLIISFAILLQYQS
jgi:hypothetical protein